MSSIVRNLAEGSGAGSVAAQKKFYSHAQASLYEVAAGIDTEQIQNRGDHIEMRAHPINLLGGGQHFRRIQQKRNVKGVFIQPARRKTGILRTSPDSVVRRNDDQSSVELI